MRWQVVVWALLLGACRSPVSGVISTTSGQVVIESTTPQSLLAPTDAAVVAWHSSVAGDYVVEVGSGTVARGQVTAAQRLTTPILGSALQTGNNTVTVVVFPSEQTAATASTQINYGAGVSTGSATAGSTGVAATGSTGVASTTGSTGSAATGSTGSASTGSTGLASTTGSSGGGTTVYTNANPSGTAQILTMTAAETTQTATFPAVDLSRSVLFFGANFDDTDPSETHIAGNLTSTTQATFWRASSGVAVDIWWYVVEFSAASGVSVQQPATTSGTTTTLTAQGANLNSDGDANIVGTTSVNPFSLNTTLSKLSDSFLLTTMYCPGTTYDNNDYVGAHLSSTSTFDVEFDNPASNTGSEYIQWQAVEYPGATVQSGSVQVADNVAAVPAVTVSAYNPANSLLVMSHDIDTAQNNSIGPNVSGFTGSVGACASAGCSTKINFARNSTWTGAGNSTNVFYSLVSFNDATFVQSGTQPFASGVASSGNITISAIDLGKSIATTLGHEGREGEGAGAAQADVGSNNFAIQIVDSTTIVITRTGTEAGAVMNWAVVQFP